MSITDNDKKLVAIFLRYLDSRMRSGALDEPAVESLEVAVQCLEAVFGVSSIDAPSNNEEIATLTALFQRTSTSAPNLSDADKQKAEELKNEGNQLMKDSNFQEALNKYSEAITIHASPVFYCNRAAAHSKLSDYRAALNDCKVAIELDPTYSKAYGRMGLAHSCLNDHERARDCYKKALELDPDNQSFKNNLEISEAKLREAQEQATQNPLGAGFPGMGGGGFPGMPNIADILSNPQMMNMATQMMADPNVQSFMSNMMSSLAGGGGGGGSVGDAGGNPANPDVMQSFLQTGQRLAQQMQEQNPDLVQRLQEQTRGGQNPPGEGEKKDDKKEGPK